MDYDYDGYSSELMADPYYDDMDEEEDYDSLDYTSMDFNQVFISCVGPTVKQALWGLYHVVIWNLVFRFTTQIIEIPLLLGHIISGCCGFFTLYLMFPSSYLILIAFSLLSYLPQRFSAYRGQSLLLLSTIVLVLNELLWLDPRVWHQIRGPQMIFIMKCVSLGFELDIGVIKDSPNIMEYFGYMLHPGTCIFGPWLSYKEYLSVYNKPRWRLVWLWRIVVSAFMSIIFLTISTCGVHYVIQDTSWKWLAAYRDSLSFRCSHYFICYFSETTLLLSGYTKSGEEDKIVISSPRKIEVPRSLIEVAVYWNLPMHNWLKIYVFNTSLRFGSFTAVIATYIVSALLHGLNFQLAAILLSLGFYTFVEHGLRKKLASIFSACIMARACKPECSHEHRWRHPIVVVVNILFTFIAVLHLAYLAVLFDTSEISEYGYSYHHTITKWGELNYISHYVALFTYFMYFLI